MQPQTRMKQPVFVIPAAMNALQALNKSIHGKGVPDKTLELIKLRASQINGCSACVDMHAYITKNNNGETDERLYGVAAWRDSPFFTEAERAALALTEAVTRLADAREEPVSDSLWQEVTRHYDEQATAALLLAIASINVWNRLNVPTKQTANPALRNYKPE